MPSPVSPCPDCTQDMVYSKETSNKKKNRRVFWCQSCNNIVIEDRDTVVMKNKHDKNAGVPVTAVNRYIFHGEFPNSPKIEKSGKRNHRE